MRALALILMLLPTLAFGQSDHDQYVAACKQQIGDIPAFSCADGVAVPVYQLGVPITASNFSKDMTCDKPALLPNGADSDGQCVPYSRILNLSTADMQVSVMCRQKQIRTAESMEFDEIDVIAHNPTTGATCWFQGKNTDESPISGASVPSPTTVGTGFPWARPETLATELGGCGSCHDNDPFMYSPFVGQVWAHVPQDPFGPYFHVDPGGWFGDWPTEVMDPFDSTCTGCHRMGLQETCGALTDWMTGITTPDGADDWAASFPLSHAMPPEHGMTLEQWETIYGPAVSQVQSCCSNPDQPMCQKQLRLGEHD